MMQSIICIICTGHSIQFPSAEVTVSSSRTFIFNKEYRQYYYLVPEQGSDFLQHNEDSQLFLKTLLSTGLHMQFDICGLNDSGSYKLTNPLLSNSTKKKKSPPLTFQ